MPTSSHYSNVIRSHVLYKIKRRDDGCLTYKAGIAVHGNEDVEKENLKTDSASCPDIGIRILFSIPALFQWYLKKIDVKGAFLQSGLAHRDVYVVPPKECEDRAFVWLLTVATYGPVNAIAKWQFHSDSTFLNLGLKTLVYIPQLFYMDSKGSLTLLFVKVTDEIFVAGSERRKREFIKNLCKFYYLGTIRHLPGSCLFFGLEVNKAIGYTVQVHADKKLAEIAPYKPSRFRRQNSSDELNSIDQFQFNSIDGSIGFIGVHACPLAAIVCRYLQQRRNSATVKDHEVQSTMLTKLSQHGSICPYRRPTAGSFQLSVMLFFRRRTTCRTRAIRNDWRLTLWCPTQEFGLSCSDLEFQPLQKTC